MADRRYVDDDGTVWASKYECSVFEQLRVLGFDVRKCGEGDSIRYTSTERGSRCLECESTRVGKDRTYTPDLLVNGLPDGSPIEPCLIESKGHWPATKRRLLRSVYKEHPETRMLLVFQNDGWVTRGKSKYSDYVAKFMPGWGCMIWNNTPRLLPGQKRGGKKGVPVLDPTPIFNFLGDEKC